MSCERHLSRSSGLPLFLLSIGLLISQTHCARKIELPAFVATELPAPAPVVANDEGKDFSCAYFYFLWGSHAESNKKFSEALEAYEKALICDPDAEYVSKKLPILLLKMGKLHAATEWLKEAIVKNPGDIDSQLLLARLEVNAGDLNEAIRIYNNILKQAPDNTTVRLRLGYLYSQQGRYKEGEEIVKALLDKEPDSYFALLYLARLAVQSADYDTASTLYEKAFLLEWSSELAYEMANFYSLREQYKQVEQLYASILKKEPENEQAALGRIHALLLQGREKEALTELARIRTASSNPTNIDLIICRVYIRSRNFNKANTLLEKILIKEESSAARYMLAVVRYEANKKEAALTHLRKINHDSEEFELSITLQIKILSELKRTHEAITTLQKLIDNPKRSQVLFYQLLANIYINQKQLDLAHEIINKGVTLYPENVQLLFDQGILLEQENKQKEAISNMEKILTLQADHVEALNYLGYTWADNNVNLDKALEYIKKAVMLKPDNGYILDSLGWVYFRMGDLEKAKIELERAISIVPEDPNIYEHLGEVYLASEQKEKAIEAWRKAKAMFKESEKKDKIQKKIDENK